MYYIKDIYHQSRWPFLTNIKIKHKKGVCNKNIYQKRTISTLVFSLRSNSHHLLGIKLFKSHSFVYALLNDIFDRIQIKVSFFYSFYHFMVPWTGSTIISANFWMIFISGWPSTQFTFWFFYWDNFF